MFIVSALFNIIMAAPALISQTGQLASTETGLYQGWQFPIGYLYFVLVFGVGYYLVSRNINHNHGIVVLGILGKVGVVTIYLIDYIWGAGLLIQTLIVAIDFLFALLFIEFLYSYRGSKSS